MLRRFATVAVVAVVAVAAGAFAQSVGDATKRRDPRAQLGDAFTKRGIDGAFVLITGAMNDATCVVVNESRADDAFLPASTFKIFNSLVALETGVAPDLDFVLEWDGVERDVAEWNRDLGMRDAFRVSALWYYQEIARRIGRERMQQWIDRVGYGDTHLGDDVTRFWLDDSLKITLRQQVEFLRALSARKLPFARRTQDLVIELMKLDEKDGRVLRAKTGRGVRSDEVRVGWFVGIVEDGERAACFATVITTKDPDESFNPVRRAISEEILGKLGWW